MENFPVPVLHPVDSARSKVLPDGGKAPVKFFACDSQGRGNLPGYGDILLSHRFGGTKDKTAVFFPAFFTEQGGGAAVCRVQRSALRNR